jgi:hypothetical protein
MRTLVFDFKPSLDVEAMPLSRIDYWFLEAVEHFKRRNKR